MLDLSTETDTQERRTWLWVTLCWIQVGAAFALFLVGFASGFSRPFVGAEWNQAGVVRRVVDDGPAARAGIRVGDQVTGIDGVALVDNLSPLYRASAGKKLLIDLERDGAARSLTVIPDSVSNHRRRALFHGGESTVWAVVSYLRDPVTLLNLVLATWLLAVRPKVRAARLAALALSFWSGESILVGIPGVGAFLSGFVPSAETAILLLDVYLSAMFYGVFVSLAIAMAETERPVGLRRFLHFIPYILSLRLFAEWSTHTVRFLHPSADVPRLRPWDEVLAPVLLFSAIIILIARFRTIHDQTERRRFRVVFLSFAPAIVAFLFLLIADLSGAPSYWRQLAVLGIWIGSATNSSILAYAIATNRLFNVRVLVRKSLQYAFARGTIVAAMAVPGMALIAFLYNQRDQSLATLIAGRPGIYALTLIPLALMLRYRRALLDRLDQKYFRERYDARQMLLRVISMIRERTDAGTLARAATAEIEKALHPTHVSLWHFDTPSLSFAREFNLGADQPSLRLRGTAALVTLISTEDDPLDLERDAAALLKRLPSDEQEWLGLTNAHLIVPMLIESRLVGFLLLGEKLSEEPYSSEDRSLLKMLAAQLALTQDYARLKATPSPTTSMLPVPPAAVRDEVRVCPACARCYPSAETRCPIDDSLLARHEGVPLILDEKYELRRFLGKGGMGSVYLATQQRLQRSVAIKILLSDLSSSTSMRARFEREAQIVASLIHSSIVTTHDFGVLPTGNAYLVMEYLEGKTLRSQLERGPLTQEETIRLLGPASEALDQAHKAGVIHRDLKPDNIMLVGSGAAKTPKILDFGLAKMQDFSEGQGTTQINMTRSGTLMGTIPYMAPELFRGHPATAQSDQYSFGLIAYEMLSGQHPFGDSKDLAALVFDHTQRDVPSLQAAVPGVPSTMAAAVERALRKDPEERFDSASEFVRAMEKTSS